MEQQQQNAGTSDRGLNESKEDEVNIVLKPIQYELIKDGSIDLTTPMSENLPANTFEPEAAKDDKTDEEDDRINQLR